VWLCNNGDLAGHARQTQGCGCGCGCRCKCKCRERQSEGRIGARAVRQVKDSGARPKTLANLWSSQAPSTVSGAGGLSKHIGGPGRPAEKRPRRRRCGNKWQRACRVLERCWSGAGGAGCRRYQSTSPGACALCPSARRHGRCCCCTPDTQQDGHPWPRLRSHGSIIHHTSSDCEPKQPSDSVVAAHPGGIVEPTPALAHASAGLSTHQPRPATRLSRPRLAQSLAPPSPHCVHVTSPDSPDSPDTPPSPLLPSLSLLPSHGRTSRQEPNRLLRCHARRYARFPLLAPLTPPSRLAPWLLT
jgi:hypothetical protein